jgi:hypothetical protein
MGQAPQVPLLTLYASFHLSALASVRYWLEPLRHLHQSSLPTPLGLPLHLLGLSLLPILSALPNPLSHPIQRLSLCCLRPWISGPCMMSPSLFISPLTCLKELLSPSWGSKLGWSKGSSYPTVRYRRIDSTEDYVEHLRGCCDLGPVIFKTCWLVFCFVITPHRGTLRTGSPASRTL